MYDIILVCAFCVLIDGMMMSSSRTVLGMAMKANRYVYNRLYVHVLSMHPCKCGT